ncbi:dihydrofolate synthase / folylpolyglutamate synthase [Ferrimonas sediminum]|uniref:Dihydrofolate synthase/folylpolyglutamate synthase n=1 Tax=Ferrimonas sediminum TaxID=718193 RepID=A0A1G8XXM1_9GAMM|nr:bifunctional tetrahydrofolate synthase/dihydrofolate synthase [Ferrimonas sediminum]SDJ94904.1 dihydrofolate synthase / folylpolyglutamate synthase [Ferrimonas sediminum]
MANAAPFSSQSLQDWLDFILAVHPSEIDMGLSRLRQVAEAMALDALPDSTVVTVAGTNGKGSTCAMMESILLQAGISTGVFSSPHLHRYNERVRVDGNELDDQSHLDAFAAIEQARGPIQLTFFEFSALGALYLFARHKPKVVLLEVGLGGRLDATNLIDADLAVITSIDLDHQEYLGDSRDSVGREKAGIFRTGVAAVIGEPDLPASVTEYAQALGTPLIRVGHEFHADYRADHWQFRRPGRHLDALPMPALPAMNAATAVAAIDRLMPEISVDALAAGLSTATLPGRMQPLSLSPRLYTDVAHNPHAARYLAQRLEAMKGQGRVLAVCAMLEDKEIEASLAPLMTVVDEWFAAPLAVPRGSNGERVAEAVGGASIHGSVAEAMAAARSQQQQLDLVIVFGSFYTVAQAQHAIAGE